jgi:hypothetical protein
VADLAQKHANFIRRYVTAVENFLAASELLSSMKGEWDANAYATGADPAGNNITDAEMAIAAPWATALQLNQAVGAAEAIGGTVTTQRGYLEALRS